MAQRVYCDQPHPGGDAEAEQHCIDYHHPQLPRLRSCAVCGTPSTGWWCSTTCHREDEGHGE